MGNKTKIVGTTTPAAPAPVTEDGTLRALQEYNRVNEEIKALEERKALLKQQILPAVDHAKGHLEIEGWEAVAREKIREIFNLSKAREKIDGRVLRPYITESKYVELRVKYVGDGAVKASGE